MSEMIERVARAINDAELLGVSLAFTESFPTDTDNIRLLREFDTKRALDIAGIAIHAMREPTDEMAMAVGASYGSAVASDWRAMIDAALK